MEAELTNNVPEVQTSKKWWDETEFPAKPFCELRDEHTLVLKSTPFSQERVITQLSADNAAGVIKAFTDKFSEVEQRFKELSDEWSSTDDKLKLAGKVARTKDYMLHAAAIGDYTPIYKELAGWHNVIHDLTETNFNAKKELIAKGNELADSEAWKETAQAFKELADKWKEIGHVDKDRNDELWNQLEAAKTKFYDRKRQHQESQEKDMLQNLDLKMELVEKAEKLAASDAWRQTTDGFKALMEEWKGVGRTMAEKNESLWQRFIAAQNVFFERKRMHYDMIKQEQEVNLVKKQEVVEKAEALSDSTDWNDTTAAYALLMEEWKASGRVAAEKADELWDRMSKAKDKFFSNKRTHFEAHRVTLDDNLAQKNALIKRAEQLKHSNSWRDATDEFAEMFEEWKKIGPVPRADHERLWDEFAKARRFFFNRKDADWEQRRASHEKQFDSRVSQTRQFLDTLKAELKEDEESLEDFKVSLNNITPGPKAKELQAHLERLIAQAGPSMERKKEKIATVEQQLKELEVKKKPKKEGNPQAAEKNKSEAPGSSSEHPAAPEQKEAEVQIEMVSAESKQDTEENRPVENNSTTSDNS